MSKQEFLKNLRAARNLFTHTAVPAISSPSDPQQADQFAARAAVWLRPQSVKGFDVADFPELNNRERSALQSAVDDFVSVADQIRAGIPITPAQLAKASPPFEAMLSILQWYLGTSSEEDTVEEVLKNVQLPLWVVNWDFELLHDHYDEPVLFLNLFMANEDSPRSEMVRSANDLSGTVRDLLLGAGCDRYPYLRIRRAA